MTLLRIAPSILLGCLLSGPAVAAADRPAAKQKLSIPPSASLSYSIKAQQKGLTLSGEASVHWTYVGNRFSVTSTARSGLFGKILESTSEGNIDEHGLAPARFTQKRFRKGSTTTSFDRAARTIRFSRPVPAYPLKGGEQDHSSVIWQLISMARATPARFKPNSEWQFLVAGDHDVDPWTFKVANQERIRTPYGEINTVHLVRSPSPDSGKQQLDIWLAPSMEWYPVRLRYSEPDGEYIEQVLEGIGKT